LAYFLNIEIKKKVFLIDVTEIKTAVIVVE